MGRRKSAVCLTAEAAFITVAAAGAAQAARVPHAGDCGELKYWHNRFCVDAGTTGKDWTGSVYF